MAIADIAIQIVTKGADLAKRQFDKLEGSTKKTNTSFAKLAKVGATAGLVVGTALTKALIEATRAFVSFDDAMTQSLAIMQTTEEQQNAMAKSARDVALNTRISAEDSAEAFFFLASAGLDAEQSISALPQVAKFAQAGMFDMATATDLATDAQSALGLTVSDAEQNLENLTRVTDVLVKANTLANASVQQFSEALTNKAGSALKVANKSIEEGVAVLSAFADRGVKGAEAGEKLNQLLRDIPRATAKNSEEFAKLNLQMFDADGNLKNVADLIEELDSVLAPMSDELKASTLDQLGLNRGVADAVKILSGAGDAIRTYQDKLEDAGGVTQEVADKQVESLQGQLEILGDKFTEVGLRIIEQYEPAFQDAIDVTDAFLDILLGRTPDIMDFAKGLDFLLGVINLINPAFHSNASAVKVVNDALEEQKRKLENDRLIKLHQEFAQALRDDAIASADAERNAHRLEVEMAMQNNTVQDLTESTEDLTDATDDLVKKQTDEQFDALMKMISAEEAYNDIFKENERLLKIREDRVTDLGKAEDKLKDAEDALAQASLKANELAKDGTEITNAESLAILRQQKRIDELTAVEDKSEIQKLELAVAIDRKNQLEKEAIEISNESIQAQRDEQRALENLEKAKENVATATERFNEAQREVEELDSPAHLAEIAQAHKDLKESIADVDAFENLFLGLSKFAEGAEIKLANVAELINTIRTGGISTPSTSSSLGTSIGGTVFGTDGSEVDADIVSPTAPSSRAGAGMEAIARMGAVHINQNITVEGKDANAQALDIIDALNRAKRNGQRVIF